MKASFVGRVSRAMRLHNGYRISLDAWRNPTMQCRITVRDKVSFVMPSYRVRT